MTYVIVTRDTANNLDVHADGCGDILRSPVCNREAIEADSLADLAREIYYGFEDFEDVTDEGALIQAQREGMVFKPCALKK